MTECSELGCIDAAVLAGRCVVHQLTLPPHVPRSKNPSGTSRDAALSMVTVAPNIRGRVYRYIARFPGGRTCDEVEDAFEFSRHQTISARIKELKDYGLLTQEGKRPTRSGRPADVHFAAPVAAQRELF